MVVVVVVAVLPSQYTRSSFCVCRSDPQLLGGVWLCPLASPHEGRSPWCAMNDEPRDQIWMVSDGNGLILLFASGCVIMLIGHVPRGVVNFFKFACSTTVTGNVLLASGRVLGNLQSQMPQTIKQLHLQIKCLTNLQMWTILMYVTQYSDMTPPTLG